MRLAGKFGPDPEPEGHWKVDRGYLFSCDFIIILTCMANREDSGPDVSEYIDHSY
jgi:hypothetical protein